MGRSAAGAEPMTDKGGSVDPESSNLSNQVRCPRCVRAPRDDAKVETLFFHVGSRQSGFVLRPDEFVRGFWQGEGQLVVQLGNCVVSVLVAGELGRALER
jgi:hypothetical protein